MSVFLINASNLKAGGGLQVADSICGQLNRFMEHHFIVVLSKYLDNTVALIKKYDNVSVYRYDIPNSFDSIILGEDRFLDSLVVEKKVDSVLTIFGPSRWRPKVPHLSGFALPQLVIPESPYFMRMDRMERIKWRWWCLIRKWSLKRSADYFWTENPFVSKRLEFLLKSKKIYTVSNFYNQVYDKPEKWKNSICLPEFKGTTCLSVSTATSHKNFGIIEGIVRYLRDVHPEFKVRFVLTFNEKDWPMAKDVCDSILYVGKIDVSECPFLYKQADIMFMPTLLECFTATYPEAMRMEVPIVTSDMEFSRGLCANAACYYSAVNIKEAAEAIYKVAVDKEYARKLVENGKRQLSIFDNYEQRAEKLINLLETIS